MGQITTKKLGNGLKLIHDRREGSALCAVSLRFRAGSIYEEKPGTAHLLEHIVLSGTKRYQTKDELEGLVGQSGGRGGGRTSYEGSTYWANTPLSALEAAITYVVETSFAPLLRKEDFIREQKVVLQEVKRRDSQSIELARQKGQAALFPETPFARPVMGTAEDVADLELEDITAFWKKNYVPENGSLSIVADFDFEKVEALVEHIFSEVNTVSGLPEFQQVVFAAPVVSDIFPMEDPKAIQSRVLIAYRAPALFDKEKQAADVLSSILGGGKTSRLFKAVRQEKGLAYDTNASVISSQSSGRFVIQSGTTPELITELIATIGGELRRMMSELCESHELETARQRNIFNHHTYNESAKEWSETLAMIALYEDNPESWLNVESRYAHVSAKDVQDVAQKIFSSPVVVAVIKRPTDELQIDSALLSFVK